MHQQLSLINKKHTKAGILKIHKFHISATCACLAILSFNVHAALVERLGGLAYYETDANLTWLADANLAQSSGYDADGFMSWADANTWAANSNINGALNWRLPNTLEPDPSCLFYSSGIPTAQAVKWATSIITS